MRKGILFCERHCADGCLARSNPRECYLYNEPECEPGNLVAFREFAEIRDQFRVGFAGAYAIDRSAVIDHLRIRGYEGPTLEDLYDRICHMAGVFLLDVVGEESRIAEREREAAAEFERRRNR